MTTVLRGLLQNVAIFGALSDSALDYLLGHAVLVVKEPNEYYFHEGDPAQSIYILESGQLAVLRHWQGEDYLIRHLHPGQCFGEMALMDMYPRSASVMAEDTSAAHKIDADVLLKLYEKDLEQFTLLQMNMGREVSRHLRDANDKAFRIQMQGFLPDSERIFEPYQPKGGH